VCIKYSLSEMILCILIDILGKVSVNRYIVQFCVSEVQLEGNISV